MKKYGFIYVIFLLLFSSVINAEELHVPIKKPSIQTLIQRVKNAKVKDKRVLINQLKIQLRTMNKESRHNVMVELKKSFSQEHSGKKLHKHRGKYKNSHEQQCTHQPRYRHLQHQRGEGNGNREGKRGGSGNRNGSK